MASHAEVPRAVGEQDLLRDTSPSSMAAFFNKSNPSLKFDPIPTYPGVFCELRGLPPDEQEKLLVGFYSQNVEALPNGAKLGRFLARINNISWFKPKSPPDEELLERLCHQTLFRLNLPYLTLRIIREDWIAAHNTYAAAISKEINARINWFALVDADGDPTRGTVSDAAFSKAWRALMDAETLEDAVKKTDDAVQRTVRTYAETWDAATAARIKSAALYATRHPEDPDRWAVCDMAFDATDKATVARTAALKDVHEAGRAAVEVSSDTVCEAITLDAADKDARSMIFLESYLPAAVNMVRGVDWIVVEDLMPKRGYNKGNPFESLMEIYERGCWPIGIVPDQNGNREFVVFVPH